MRGCNQKSSGDGIYTISVHTTEQKSTFKLQASKMRTHFVCQSTQFHLSKHLKNLLVKMSLKHLQPTEDSSFWWYSCIARLLFSFQKPFLYDLVRYFEKSGTMSLTLPSVFMVIMSYVFWWSTDPTHLTIVLKVWTCTREISASSGQNDMKLEMQSSSPDDNEAIMSLTCHWHKSRTDRVQKHEKCDAQLSGVKKLHFPLSFHFIADSDQ